MSGGTKVRRERFVIDIGEIRGRREKAAPLMVGRLQWMGDRKIRHAESMGIEII